MSTMHSPFTLPCGVTLPNRLAKAAMEEGLCDAEHGPGEPLIQLYRRWAQGQPGLMITGNVMVDRAALTGPCNVVVEDTRNLEGLKAWAQAGQAGGCSLWPQINHPGRQVFAAVSQESVAPSAVPVQVKGAKGMFSTPRALESGEIEAIIQRFATAARVLEMAGFAGVQLHGAHGYLISQFLSPRVNQRTDAWGGDIEGRARMLLMTVRAVKAAVGEGFGVALKLNSADFQRGGFSADDAKAVVAMLNDEGLDFLELSGGSYESPAMSGGAEAPPQKESTRLREAYFLVFAEELREIARMPLMVTGGFRSAAGIQDALASGALDIVGMAKPFAQDPDVAASLLSGRIEGVQLRRVRMPVPALGGLAEMAWAKRQMHRLAAGRSPDAWYGAVLNLALTQLEQGREAKRYQAWLRTASPATPLP